ncbi:MAG TPA: prolyl oligopeptidase family serine peptidase, partial [Pirellulaceae bacterium]|nr:prolyl oligopeptidase family serine peptidase [Pirellulaceae bacterium]
NQGANAPRSPDSDAPRSPTDPLAERVGHTRYPAILYVCGHGNVKKDGISYGAKSHYQHHGAWFARNGYVCLVIDTLQLSEIEGIHHGTYRYGMWWWLNRGYTPAGVEAWNCVRALDYLQSRPEVDGEKLGVTGRSGGGAYSWWIAAIDERIKCAVPVAGITDLQNHVVDGCVEGHCDCMYMVNTYRWDYPQVAALVAPRPLLISNTDSDGIFPLDGVVRVFDKARRIYTLLGKRDQIGLNITSGGHKDTQELQVTAMRWFNHHLKGEGGPVTNHAEKFFEPEQLKVFDKLPEDQINTRIHETFVAAAPPPKVPESKEEWEKMREGWMKQIKEKSLRAWPERAGHVELRQIHEQQHDGLKLRRFEFESEPGVVVELLVVSASSGKKPETVSISILSADRFDVQTAAIQTLFPGNSEAATPDEYIRLLGQITKVTTHDRRASVFVAPRGVGKTRWDQSEKKQIQNRRRFYLLGETLESCQVYDVRRAIQAVKQMEQFSGSQISLTGEHEMCGVLLLTALFEPRATMVFANAPVGKAPELPTVLNVQRTMDVSVVAALAAERCPLIMEYDGDKDWSFVWGVSGALNWPLKQFQPVDRSRAQSKP